MQPVHLQENYSCHCATVAIDVTVLCKQMSVPMNNLPGALAYAEMVLQLASEKKNKKKAGFNYAEVRKQRASGSFVEARSPSFSPSDRRVFSLLAESGPPQAFLDST